MKFLHAFIRAFVTLFVHLAPIWGFLALLITGGGLLLSMIEKLPVGRGIYFAWITATTVGFGDITPSRPMGKLVCVSLALIGLINTSIIGAIGLNAVLVASRRHLDLDGIRARLGHDFSSPSVQPGNTWLDDDKSEPPPADQPE
jgi:voltage-gated potassium channel